MAGLRPTRYLFVCTANVNRSPTAAVWTEHHFAQRFVSCDIRSAGTHAWEGMEAGAFMVDAMRELGFDLRAHRSTPLSQELADWADHIVVMQPEHWGFVEELAPEAAKGLIAMWEYIEPEATHVVDPQGGDLEGFRHCARELDSACHALVDAQLLARRKRAAPVGDS